MEHNNDFSARYHPAAMLLIWRAPMGRLVLDGSEEPYDAFYEIVKPLLRSFDYKPLDQPSREIRWHHGLRLALLHMREDKHPAVGYVRYHGNGTYELTDRGKAALESHLLGAPLEWLELTSEELEDGKEEFRWCHPMTGDEIHSWIWSPHTERAF
jgi:hypothetical protein